ncbi:MAG: Sir2 family NAD-dependent protein deacetylase [Acidimicrobiaceae bacterium]|nr:Sir2 family NAD-dependent protein deacetylase [Acidimicrobiaceae bacterium]MCY4280182.1 Sir2 family NAD-dependent protein deacetylase [Acidimicrobiaceae bacterium]MCY4293445.1 Sir2 family NAD-dependent protein deacetylase [Acidimicrobiaceae bacterium]
MRSDAAAAAAVAGRMVDQAQRVTVLTGAGISTDSGLRDFRGPQGIWTRDPAAERASNIDVYVSDPEVRRSNWARRASGEIWAEVEPNEGHEALVALERRGKLHLLITQNVDELHQRAGSDPGCLVEIHGTTRKVQCLSCESYRADMQEVLERVRAGEEDPPCPLCGGILKSATVSFGQSLDPVDLARAERASLECDLFLAVGTTLAVAPINMTARLAVQSGARLVIVNGEATEFDHLADVLVAGSISEALPVICGAEALPVICGAAAQP